MPTDTECWKEIMIESGQMPDDNGIWRYNPQAIENPYGWKQTVMEYDYCPFCGEKKWGYRKHGYCADELIEWFICIACDREVI